MTHGQWVKIVRRVMLGLGKGQAEAREFTYNSARRCLPTAAHVMGFSAETRQAIGSWEELPQAEGGREDMLEGL